MAQKKDAPKFTAFVRYTVEVEVPIRAENLEQAVAQASLLTTSDLYETLYDILESDQPSVRGVFAS